MAGAHEILQYGAKIKLRSTKVVSVVFLYSSCLQFLLFLSSIKTKTSISRRTERIVKGAESDKKRSCTVVNSNEQRQPSLPYLLRRLGVERPDELYQARAHFVADLIWFGRI